MVKLRSIYASKFDHDAESGGAPQATTISDATENNFNTSGNTFDESKDAQSLREQEIEALDPIQLPQSTHSLLFTEPVLSVPFAFAVGIMLLSFVCLALVLIGTWMSEIPVNVTVAVRVAQYASILVILLMEEEIPTGLYLLRMIPKQSLRAKFPQMKYRKFIMSSVVRILNGYYFILNGLLLLVNATVVIEIFYNVLAIQ